jgi:DNA repair protein SbcD/Mre11
MIKVLHTADWHLGVRLHKKDLSQDHMAFLHWLINIIRERNIDVLLISGDIFDQSNPSAEARQLYYSFLKQLISVECKVIITGGNHDSPAVLNGPQEILKILDVHVIGGVPQDHKDQLVCLKNDEGKVEAVVCAVPYLRDGDVRLAKEGEMNEERQNSRKQGMKLHFENLVQSCSDLFGEVPVILMAHLFASGALKDEQKRDITIGGLDAFIATDFPDGCKYVALGHIHRPMKIDNKDYIRYSGSPIPLSFSEMGQQKTVIELEIADGCIHNIQSLPVPFFRNMLQIKGSLSEVKEQLSAYTNDKNLIAITDLDIIEEEADLNLGLNVHDLITTFTSEEIEILNFRYSVINTAERLDVLVGDNTEIEALEPLDVLKIKLGAENISEDQQKLIEEAFMEILNAIENEN